MDCAEEIEVYQVLNNIFPGLRQEECASPTRASYHPSSMHHAPYPLSTLGAKEEVWSMKLAICYRMDSTLMLLLLLLWHASFDIPFVYRRCQGESVPLEHVIGIVLRLCVL